MTNLTRPRGPSETSTSVSPDERFRLPDFVMIGAAKAGTTSMHYYLGLHPDITMSWPKETNFFTREDYLDALPWYATCFVDAPGLRGEASPKYANYPNFKHVPERIHSLVPHAKLLFMVRDPVERTVSQYHHKFFNRTESRGINEVFRTLDDEDDTLIAESRYALQLEQYLPYFPMSQIMVIDNRDLRDARDRTVSATFSFLGVDPDFTSPAFDKKFKDRGKTVRMSAVAMALHDSAPARLGRRLLPRDVREPLFERARRVLSPNGGVSQEPLAPDVRARLEDLFRADAARLRELTGQPFSHWSV